MQGIKEVNEKAVKLRKQLINKEAKKQVNKQRITKVSKH